MNAISRVRAGIIGTGFIGQVHLQALRQLGVQVVGIAGSSKERAESVAESWGVERAFADAAELIGDPEIDVVHITSPNDLHYEHAKAALLAGKHVVCEKPLAMNPRETAELERLADESGRVAAVNFNLRFYPQVREMRERIRSGLAGTPYLVTGSYLQDWLLKPTDWNWRVEEARGGALRVVGDLGSHWFDAVQFIVGSPIAAVLADLATFVPVRRRPLGEIATFSSQRDTETVDYEVSSEDAASILVRFADGARGAVTISQVSAGRKNAVSIEVGASEQSLAWRGERPDELWIGHRDAPNEVLLRDPALLSAGAAGIATLPGGHAEGFGATFTALYADVYADVVSGRPSTSPAYARFSDGHNEALIIEAVGASAHSGRWITIERTKAGQE